MCPRGVAAAGCIVTKVRGEAPQRASRPCCAVTGLQGSATGRDCTESGRGLGHLPVTPRRTPPWSVPFTAHPDGPEASPEPHHACVRACMHVCVHACVCAHVHPYVCVCMHACVCMCMCVCMCVCMCMLACVCMCACMCVLCGGGQASRRGCRAPSGVGGPDHHGGAPERVA